MRRRASRRYQIDPAADRDLDEHAEFLAEESPRLALRFLAAAAVTFRRLAGMPGIGSPRQFQNPRLAGVRQWRVQGFPNHLVFYRETDDGIEIVRVLHGARDIDRILEE